MIEEHEELLLDAFRSFTKFERIFRYKIGEILGKKLGTQWTLHLPVSIRERLEQKLKDESGSANGPERDENLLNYADFSELVSIVQHFWGDIFEGLFHDKEITMGLFETVRTYRNSLMHSVLRPSQCPEFIKICEDLIGKIEGFSRDLILIPPTNVATPKTVTKSLSASEDQKVFQQRVSTILNQMSGFFEGERDALITYVERNLGLCTNILLDEIRQKFSDLAETDKIIDTLGRKLPPEKPKQPEPKLDLNKWLKWAATSYLPYRYWMMLNGQIDKEIESMSLIYEDWLYQSYNELLNKYPERFVFGSYLHINKHLNNNKKVLWVLIDNLPLFYQSRFTRQLGECGFKVIESIRQISMLPSFTHVSRISALAGHLPNQMPEIVNEKQIVCDAWQKRTNKRIAWLENLQDLEHASQYQADLYIYVYSHLDKLWHTPDNKDVNREEDIEAALASFISKLSKSFNKLVQSDPTILIISSDHGTIFQPPGSEILSIPSSAIKDDGYEEHRRFVCSSKPDSLNKNEWFYLDKDMYHLHQNYAVVRGWRFIGEQRRSFTHGGLSPEETIVPFLVCELGEAEFERLQPIFEQASPAMRLGIMDKLVIRIRNPFPMSIENLVISLSDFGLTFPPVDIDPQMEAETAALDFSLPSKMKVEQDSIFVNVVSRFTTADQQRTQTTRLMIKVRRIFKTDFDDDLGEMFK